VHLTAGLNRVAFETSITNESGPVSIEAEVRIPNDTFADNNKFRNSIVVKGPPRILYAEERAESAQYFASALKMDGFVVNSTNAAGIPSTVGELDAYDAVILSDIPAGSLTPQQMRALATYVQDLGGGLIFTGGENVYGETGY
jgi:Ca-activated chloride channel family protein